MPIHSLSRISLMAQSSRETLTPQLLRSFHDEFEFPLLVLLGEFVAADRRGEAALRRQGQTF